MPEYSIGSQFAAIGIEDNIDSIDVDLLWVDRYAPPEIIIAENCKVLLPINAVGNKGSRLFFDVSLVKVTNK